MIWVCLDTLVNVLVVKGMYWGWRGVCRRSERKYRRGEGMVSSRQCFMTGVKTTKLPPSAQVTVPIYFHYGVLSCLRIAPQETRTEENDGSAALSPTQWQRSVFSMDTSFSSWIKNMWTAWHLPFLYLCMKILYSCDIKASIDVRVSWCNSCSCFKSSKERK